MNKPISVHQFVKELAKKKGKRLAGVAEGMNSRRQNLNANLHGGIGLRKLGTILEQLDEDVTFLLKDGSEITVDPKL